MSQTASAARWRQVKEIFQQAVELDTGARAGYLASACADDAGLRGEVEMMLAVDEDASAFLEKSPVSSLGEKLMAGRDQMPEGQRIGPYRVLREIGHGGMGSVYLAERDDEHFDQQVAIKVIRRGMDSDDILRRFHNERQILANLNHPNIARLIDGGSTADGRPYYVMEYIAGRGIDEYCDARRLSITDRLGLFRQVCAAVHYAHQRLVIHRDLKPSNILVTDEGVVKLLDFGIAKLLASGDHGQTATVTLLGIMTPAYASPEQVRSDNITTASDVYSLGVILYELLTGHRPYHFPSARPDEMARVICESLPERPSAAVVRDGGETLTEASRQNVPRPAAARGAVPRVWLPSVISRTRGDSVERLRRRLHGDLDNIALMALRKDAQRRYASVEQFSDDIRRYLEGLPVIARPDTLGYRAAKFVRRNKAGVAAAFLVLLSLCGGIVTTWHQARVAQRQRALAESRFSDVRQLANSFVFKFHDAIVRLPGSTPVREMLVKDATAYLDKLAAEAGGDRELQHELALAYLKLGDAQGKIYDANTGHTAGALASYRKAIELLEPLARSGAGRDAKIKEDLLKAYQTICALMLRTGQGKEAKALLEKAVPMGEEMLAAEPGNPARRLMLVRLKIQAADTTPDFARRIELYSSVLPEVEELCQSDARSVEALRALAQVNQRIGTNLLWLGGKVEKSGGTKAEVQSYYQRALPYHRRSLEAIEQVHATDPQNYYCRRSLATGCENVGVALRANGDIEGSLRMLRQSLGIMESAMKSDPENREAQFDVAGTLKEIGDCHAQRGNRPLALASYRKALSLKEAIAAADEKNLEVRNDVASLRKLVDATAEKR